MELCLDGHGPSDQVNERFGVREVCSVIDQDLSGHVFCVNREKVHRPFTFPAMWLSLHQDMAWCTLMTC